MKLLLVSLVLATVVCTTCDDGNEDNYDGCSSEGVVEYGYVCESDVPNVCKIDITYGESVAANVCGALVIGFTLVLGLLSFILKGKFCSAFFNTIYVI